MKSTIILIATSFLVGVLQLQAQPLMEWEFNNNRIQQNSLSPTVGYSAFGESMPDFELRAGLPVAIFDGKNHAFLISDRIDTLTLPKRALTVAGWVMVDYPQSWGGFISVMQDNGDYEKGWVFGYTTDRFSLGLASVDADRGGRGYMTYLQSSEPFAFGKWYHVAATYDGKLLRLYVNGEFSAETTEQSGDILYPNSTWFTLASYRDEDENNKLSGAMHNLQIWDQALPQETFRNEFKAKSQLKELPATPKIELTGLVIAPFINFVTHYRATVSWKTIEPSVGYVRYGTHSDSLNYSSQSENSSLIHNTWLTDLKADTKYFYKVFITEADGTEHIGEILTFQTAMHKGKALSFGVIADTQNNPAVWGTISSHLWAERPNFIIHAGDIVSPGTDIYKWIYEYFAPSKTLQERVPIFTVLGNHERDAQNYYDLMDYPDPKYYYTFDYSNVRFFMIDTNKDVSKDTEQYSWLDEQLRLSDSQWNIVVHHHPPFSSDEDDYGNSWKGTSTLGDTKLRDLTKLYEKHEVPLVVTGHIHTYERTWPIYDGKVDLKNGVTYVVAGGGGGPLENAAPTRSWFTRKVFRGNHYAMVHVHDSTLEWITYGLDGNVLDAFTISRPSSSGE